MSRSVHTRPKRVLAPDRVRAPYQRRRVAGLSRAYRLRRMIKEQGICAVETPVHGGMAPRTCLPRITMTQVPSGWDYPVDRTDIARILRFFGPEVSYGLRSIDLLASPQYDSYQLRFGTLVVPGQIRLFALPLLPWTLLGSLPNREFERLTRAGANIEVVAEGLQTIVDWSQDALHDFVLFDVLMHEIGHHVVQQYTGKRHVRVMRTKDHEAFADQFALRCRREYTPV